ncbi:MAG: DUF523 domain-containing protein [Planctomycetota bacterium]|nr:DUF523 domain-containing protein [Planctomycetota bacterium]
MVSACLLGQECRYDGRASVDVGLLRRLSRANVIPVCPEELGGLGTPREPAEIQRGAGAEVLDGVSRVIDRTGRDVTEAFIGGAREALNEGLRAGAQTAYLKSRSPSCGLGRISSGGGTRAGNGVFAELCQRSGVEVIACEGAGSGPSDPSTGDVVPSA